MKTLNIKIFEEHSVILERDVDYTKANLEQYLFTKKLPQYKLDDIARKLGYSRCSFSGAEKSHKKIGMCKGIYATFIKTKPCNEQS